MDKPLSIPLRRPETHKGDAGRVLVIAGSRGMAGAAALCGRAALRSGAGLVTVATPESVYPIVAAKLTCCTTLPLPETQDGTLSYEQDDLLKTIERIDVLALGPGISTHVETAQLVLWILRDVRLPIVLDADGLNCLASSVEILQARRGPLVVTPHPGEMARLCGLKSVAAVQKDRESVARRFAAQYGCVVVLKGHRTVVTDGKKLYVNVTGNPGMATGGTGDVLTGTIAALIAQKLKPFEAARLGTYVHGLAGDEAAEAKGEIGLIAEDVLEALPTAFQKIQVEQ